MAEGLNDCDFIGHVGRTPELNFTQSGTPVLNIRIACGESYVDKNGDRQERVEWVPLVVWGKRAEGLSKVVEKGTRLHAKGRFTTREWTDKDGNKRYSSEINVRNVLLLATGGRQIGNTPSPGDEDVPEELR
jgi:single-strand DNA-binding protein